MGCSATNASSDLEARAQEQEALRVELIRRQFAAEGKDFDSVAVDAQLRQAAATLRVYRHDQSPDADRFGAPVRAFCHGELYETESVHRDSGGDKITSLVTRNGPLVKRTRVREVQLAEHTRVVVEVR